MSSVQRDNRSTWSPASWTEQGSGGRPSCSYGQPSAFCRFFASSAVTERGFAVLQRRWSQGDTVTLQLPLAVRTEPIDDLHPETVAVLRGPLMYVELNPAPGPAALGQLERQVPLAASSGMFVEHTNGRDRVHAPLHLVGEESYTTYFDKS